jgi:peptide/nickel transport system permease protein
MTPSWLIQRLFHALIVVLVMTVIVFVGLNVIGNPVDILISPHADQADRARQIAALGLDQPLWRQYLEFLWGALHGNMGNSFVFNSPALKIILERAPATFELAFGAVFLSIVIGIPLGLYAGFYPNSLSGRLIMTGSVLGFSLPSFWVGVMFIMVFSVHLGWLPSSGRGETVAVFGVEWSFLTLDGLKHMLLPTLNLAIGNIALVLRLTRSGVRENISMDYVKFARAKGIKPRRIVFVHILRNLLIPIVTVTGLDFGRLIAFAIITENIFAWPGMGKLIIDSIAVLDRPVIVAYLVMIVILFVTINLIVDVLYALLDPRIRVGDRND